MIEWMALKVQKGSVMNQIKISGVLKKGDRKYPQGQLYWLDVTRRSGTVDTLMVLSADEDLEEGEVTISGVLKSDFIYSVGVPAFIMPEIVEPGSEEGVSEAVVTGRLKKDLEVRVTGKHKDANPKKKPMDLCNVLVVTEDGQIPVLLWEGLARSAAKKFKAGDEVKVTGRLQSRSFMDRKREHHTTYELSAFAIEPA